MLTEQEKLDYLQNVVIPVYQPLNNSKCCVAILNFKCQLAWISSSMSAYLQGGGYEDDKHLNKLSTGELPADFTEKFCKAHNVTPQMLSGVMLQTGALFLKAMETKDVVNFLVLLPLHKSLHGYARTAVPIIHPTGEVVGVSVTAYEYSFFGVQEFLEVLHNEKYEAKSYYHEQDKSDKNDRGLSPRQKEILFLVGQGLSQDYAAKILGIKRGTLSKIITDQICPKFNIFPPHYIKLLEAVKNEGLDRHIPESFWQTRVIEI